MDKEKLVELINNYWRFDEHQQHRSSWHDKQDLLKAIDDAYEAQKVGKAFAMEIIALFNATFKTKFTWNAFRQRQIMGRMKEGQSMKPKCGLDTFRAVFEHRKHVWEKDPEMSKHLVPETLCAQKHFFKYLDLARQDKEWRAKYILKYHTPPKPTP